MNIKLFSTTAFRLTIIYAALFSLFSAVTLGFIYWSLHDEIESQIDARLRLETDFLVNLYDTGALNELCLLYTSPSPRDATLSRMPSSA